MKTSTNKIPSFLKYFVSHILPETNHSYLSGDFDELYDSVYRSKGRFYAYFWIIGQIFTSIPGFINDSFYGSKAMFKNYIKIAFRTISRNKVHSFINIAGLSVGIGFSLLVFLFVKNEYSYDSFHKDKDLIYRVWRYNWDPQYGDYISASTSIRIADDFRRLYPEIEAAARISDSDEVITIGTETMKEDMYYVDRDFFNIFTFPVIAGNKENPMPDVSSIVLSTDAAAKYFGDSDPIGKQLHVKSSKTENNYTVSAVFDNRKHESSLVFDFLLPYEKFLERSSDMMLTNYNAHNPSLFFKLKANTNVDDLRQKILKIDDHIDQSLREGAVKEHRLQNITEMHLNHEISSGHVRTNPPIYSYVLSGLGGIVLLIACINFMTLSIGMSANRAKEVGVRKVIGAFKIQLIKQYLGEALLSSTIALASGFLFALAALPVFNQFSGKALTFSFSPELLLMVIVLALLVGLISGSYPALVLSRFNPLRVLKGAENTGGKNLFTKSLVVIQFSLSIFLIVSTIVFQRQLGFITDKNLGFDKQRLVEVSLNASGPNADQLFSRFAQEIRSDSRILNVAGTSSNYFMSWGRKFWTQLGIRNKDGSVQYIHFNRISPGYLETMGITLVQGKGFSEDAASEVSNEIIINETAARYFGLKDPLRERIEGFTKPNVRIAGVVRDFHFASLHEEIKPLILGLTGDVVDTKTVNEITGFWPHSYDYAVVKIAEGDARSTLDFLTASWRKVSPNSPVEIKFVDDTIQAYYESEKRWGEIISYASFFAIAIASLGLFGLSLIAVKNRIKEIGIRKVLGASASTIVSLLSRELLLLIGLASVIAWPVAFQVMDSWLQNFAFKIKLDTTIFAVSIITALVIGIITISFQTIKAATSNPVNTLRSE